MSWWVAGTTFAAGAYSAYNKRKGANSMADERRRAARESLLTAKYNIRERNKESRQTQFQVLETGGNLTQQIAIEGKRAEGAATVAGGSGGAVIDSGSPRAVLTNIAQEALAAQTDAILDTKNRIKAISRDTENQNKSEWRNAKLNKEQQYRIASKEKQAAQNEFASDMIKTGFESYAGGSTMAGTGNISKWGKAAKTTKQIGTGAHVAQSAVRIRPNTRPKKKVNWNIANKSKYSYGSFKSNKSFYPKGKALQSGKIPGGGSYYKNRGLKSSPYNQYGYKPAWNESGGWGSNLMNFFRGTGLYGTASSKRF